MDTSKRMCLYSGSLLLGLTTGMFSLRVGGLLSLALLSGLLFAVLVLGHPIIGVLTIIAGTALIPYGRGDLPLTNIGSIHIPDLILYSLLTAVLFKSLNAKHTRFIGTPLDVPLLWFAVAGITSLVVGKILQGYEFFGAFLIFKPILYYLLALVVTNMIHDKKELKILINGCFCIGIIAASWVALAAWMWPPEAGAAPMEIFYRYSSGSTGWLLTFWTLVVLASLIMVREARVLYVFGFVITFAAIILSFSRHWWISFACSAAIMCVLSFKEYIRKISVIFVLTVLFVLAVMSLRVEPITTYVNLVTLRAASLMSKNIESWEIRGVENKYAMKTILAHPVWGIGFVRAYRPPIYGPEDTYQWFVHHGYLWILLKMGIIGFIPFIWFSYVFVRRGIKYWSRVEDKFLKGIVLGSVCSYLGMAVGNFAAPHFMQNWEVAVVGLSFGINEAIYKSEGINDKDKV